MSDMVKQLRIEAEASGNLFLDEAADELEAAQKAGAEMRGLATYIIEEWNKSKSWNASTLLNIARTVLFLDCGKDYVHRSEIERIIRKFYKISRNDLEMKTTITVTEDDIKKGVRRSACACPVARAIYRSIKRPCTVGCTKLEILDPYSTTFCRLPVAAQAFIEQFDLGKPVNPFSFKLHVPAKKK